MKINLDLLMQKFEQLLLEMNVDATDFVELQSAKQWKRLNANELRALSNEGLEISPNDIDLISNAPLEYRGEKVTLYIKDHNTYGRSYSPPKFHIAYCSTLKKMHENKKYNRYVVTSSRNKKFLLRINGQKRNEELDVCKNCLDSLSYAGYSAGLSQYEKDRIVGEFSLETYFSGANYNLAPRPMYSVTNAPENEYSMDWPRLSIKMRELEGWKCTCCGIDLSNKRKYLQVHHIDSDKTNNHPSNLKVLCVSCHSFEPNHEHLRNSPVFMAFIREILSVKGRQCRCSE